MSIFRKPKMVCDSRAKFRLVQQEVEAKLAAGHRIRHIYNELLESGRISMSYSTFTDYIRGKGERLHSSKKRKPLAALPGPQAQLVPVPQSQSMQPVPSPQSQPIIARAEKVPAFYHEKVADLDALGPPKRNEKNDPQLE